MRKALLIAITLIAFVPSAFATPWNQSRWSDKDRATYDSLIVHLAAILARADSATALYWSDTTAIILTISDTASFTARIAKMPDSSTVLFWADTTVALANSKALIGAKADSSAAVFWPDTTVILTNAKALIGARADSAAALYWPDTTVILAYTKTLDDPKMDSARVNTLLGAKSDTASVLFWPDTTAVLENVKALIGARADSATALYWPDTTVTLASVKASIATLQDSLFICGTDSFIAANTSDTIIHVDIPSGAVIVLTWAEPVADSCAHIWVLSQKADCVFVDRSGDSDANKTYNYIIQK